jgi:hypothetical protein
MEALVSVTEFADNLSSVVRYALETTRATATCPFHWNVTIRVGDDAAESHAVARARNISRSDTFIVGREGYMPEVSGPGKTGKTVCRDRGRAGDVSEGLGTTTGILRGANEISATR